MSFEQVFECRRKLRKLRSGPLAKLLEGFCNWLLENGFSGITSMLHTAHFNSANTQSLNSFNGLVEKPTQKDC